VAGAGHTAIMEATCDVVAIADTDGEIVYLNAGGRRMLGLDPGEVVVGRSLGELHPPWAARRVLEQGIPTATRDGLWSGETAVLARSGEEIPVLQLILAHADSRGSLQYLSTVVRDIRAQKAAERALLARNELLEKVFDSSPLMLALMRPEGTVEWANRPWERTLGWSVPEMQGRDMLGEFFPDPEQRARAAELIRAADGKWQDLRTRTRSGRVITTAWANVRLSDGTVIGLGQDVSERRSLEERLHHSQKMEAVGQLAGGVAHDFNNVLTSVMGYTEALLDELEAGSPLRADALEIRKAAERAAALTRQLLTFSRKQLIELEVLDLNHAVAGIGTMLRRLLGGSIELRTDLADGLGRVRADAGQLDQVIVNLAVNARDAMPEGGVLTIRTRNVTLDRTYEAVRAGLPAGFYVALVLTDTGVGMDEAVQARIFEPFFTTKDRAHGTGLGLATVYGIVKQSGGAIEVWSAPGQGATFTVYLPREEAPAPSAAIAAPDGAPPSGVETVLLVEDEEPVRKLACRALRRAGYRVLEAADPDRAVELSRRFSGPIDLVLSDVMMTGRTGPQLVSLLRAERPEFRVLYMSGFADGLLPEGTDGDDFLPKPFTPRRLANKVREVLDR
jgi:PAS domain S-box-containing protein